MLCYFISKKTFKILNIIESESYSIAYDLDCGGKTSIIVAGNPGACDGDFAILKDEKKTLFQGIIDKIENSDDEVKHTVSCLEMECCFDQKIFLTNADLIKSTGIEDFIAKTIKDYFSESGDSFTDMTYIDCKALTHTKISAKPGTDKGIYNFKTYIGNTKQNYGIFLDFKFEKEKLRIFIHKKVQSAMQIDTTVSDIPNCIEAYKVKVLSKLSVKWLNTATQEETMRYFYLHSDRSISEVDTDRIDGTISTLFVETETEEEMKQEVTNEFKGNSYSHSIETTILSNSKLYPISELYAGHEVMIKTSVGVKESIISEVAFSDLENIVSVKFGILKVMLTDKLKR